MKKTYHLVFAIILFASFNALSQEFPTIGEVYDYEIGDVFHYNEDGLYGGYEGGSGGFSSIINVEVIDKYFSDNSDTVFYTVFERSYISSSEHPEWYIEERTQDLEYYDLTSIVPGSILIENPEVYNGRKTSQSIGESGYQYIKKRYTVGCGVTHDEYNYDNPYEWSEWRKRLVYFKKGDEEWGEEQVILGLDEEAQLFQFTVFPNPVKNQLNIKTQFAKEYEVQIFNSIGQLISIIPSSSTLITISLEHYLNGLYVAHFVDENGIMIEKRKFIKH